MGMGGSATQPRATPPSLDLSRLGALATRAAGAPGARLGRLASGSSRLSLSGAPAALARLRVAAFIGAWFVLSLASLFVAKHVLHAHPVSETQLTLSLFLSSVVFGLLLTKGLRLHTLARLTRSQLRAVVPLSAAFLVKEVLKYASLARVSVNLVNTIRSLGPLFNVLIEFVVFRHRPPRAILGALCPIVVGVALTTVDEMHSASLSRGSLLVALSGFGAAVVSTAINNAQNIYSKVLFGKERIDPVSLQIYLSAISLALMSPPALAGLLVTLASGTPAQRAALLPPTPALLAMAGAGLVNFLASQLAFNTLNLISPLSYSVANTFKRVCIAVIAIAYFSERLSLVNGVGILVSIGGLFVYERKARSLKQARAYRRESAPTSASASASTGALGSAQSAGSSATSTSTGAPAATEPQAAGGAPAHHLINLPPGGEHAAAGSPGSALAMGHLPPAEPGAARGGEDGRPVLGRGKHNASGPDLVRLDVGAVGRAPRARKAAAGDDAGVLASPRYEAAHATHVIL